MAVADFIAFDNRNDHDMPEPLDELLMRLRQIRRRLERWMPSSDSIALWSHDYSEVFGAAKRLEATVGELDSGIEGCGSNPSDATVCLRTLLDKLERTTNEFEDSIIRNTAVA
jgi:hypothetical protein